MSGTNHPQSARSPHSRSPLDVLRRYQRAMVHQDANELADLYAPDAVHELPFLFPGMPARYEGREQLRAAYGAAWDASPARPQEVQTIAVHRCEDPEVLVIEQVVVGVNAATGERFELPSVLVLHVHRGRITHVRDYMDGLAVARAMHRLPAVVKALEG
ncbi:MAG TPA: nuclear transport factor 2 family protein [Nocardioides sp.]|jgi:uncharacterized protein (TIGR02246 family)|nr:nuclear transport factor 2 family protein [Nocardioides sp.]